MQEISKICKLCSQNLKFLGQRIDYPSHKWKPYYYITN